MNKLIYTLAILIVAAMSSCNVEQEYGNNNRTLQGRKAFEQVKSLTDNSIFITELASRLSLYIESPEEGRQAIKDYFLHDYTITLDASAKSISAKEDFYTWTFYHNGKTINQAGAEWQLETNIHFPYQETNTVLKQGFYTLTSTGDKLWNIVVKENNLWLPPLAAHSANLKIAATETVAQAPNLYNYTITEGEGHGDGTMAYLSYKYASPIIYSSTAKRPLSMKEADIDIVAQVSNDRQDKIKATLKDFIDITITMYGITEDYSIWW